MCVSVAWPWGKSLGKRFGVVWKTLNGLNSFNLKTSLFTLAGLWFPQPCFFSLVSSVLEREYGNLEVKMGDSAGPLPTGTKHSPEFLDGRGGDVGAAWEAHHQVRPASVCPSRCICRTSGTPWCWLGLASQTENWHNPAELLPRS